MHLWAMPPAADFRLLSIPKQVERAVHSRLRKAAMACCELQGVEQSVWLSARSRVDVDP